MCFFRRKVCFLGKDSSGQFPRVSAYGGGSPWGRCSQRRVPPDRNVCLLPIFEVFMSRIKLHLGSSVLVCVVAQVILIMWHLVMPRLEGGPGNALLCGWRWALRVWKSPPETALFPALVTTCMAHPSLRCSRGHPKNAGGLDSRPWFLLSALTLKAQYPGTS